MEMMMMTIGITGTSGNFNCNPSMAVVTVILGVMIPSASMAHPPITAGMTSHLAFFRTREYREKIPPSPLLSALRVITTYLMVVCKVSVQMIQEIAPSTISGVTACPVPFTTVKIAFNV
ncbi:hypothetical protein D3C85_1570040 [compost metagenome]